MKHVVAILVLLLIVLHQDFWFWEDDTLLMGFMPIGLFYHACLSMAAATVWFMAVKFAWPHELEVEGEAGDSDAKSHGKGASS